MERNFEALAGIFGGNSIVNFKGNNPLDLVLWLVDYPAFIHFYGFNFQNLDPNTKWWLGLLTGIDENGNLSRFNLILDMAVFLPLGGLVARGLKLLGFAPKFLQGGKALPFLFNNKTLQTISNGLSRRWKEFERLINPYLEKIPWLKKFDYKIAWKYTVDAADLIGFKPTTWWKYTKNTPLGKWISNKLGYTNPMTKHYADFWKAAAEGELGYPVEIAGKYLKLKDHKIVGGILTVISGLYSIYSAYQRANDTKNWINNNTAQIRKTITSVARTLKSPPVVKVAKIIAKTAWKAARPHVKTVAKKIIKGVEKGYNYVKNHPITQKLKSGVKWALKQPLVKKILNTKPVQRVVNAGKQLYNAGKSVWNGFKKWAFRR